MTRQTAYEKVRDYFQQPGAELCNDSSGQCYYRHPDDDRRCAAGVLIEDADYDSKMEGKSIQGVLEEWSVDDRFAELRALGDEFLTSIQEAHDVACDLDEFLMELDERAAQYGCRIPVPA